MLCNDLSMKENAENSQDKENAENLNSHDKENADVVVIDDDSLPEQSEKVESVSKDDIVFAGCENAGPPRKKIKKDQALKPTDKNADILKTFTNVISSSTKPVNTVSSVPEPTVKQATLPFKVISKDEKEQSSKDSSVSSVGKIVVNESILKSPKPNASTSTPTSVKKSPPLSKEERQRQKQEKEQARLARAREQEVKRLAREEERIAKLAEKEKREEERKEKERLREEEKQRKEVERLKREEERKQKEAEKEEEKRKREAEREEDKKLKEDERLHKEEERKQKEEERKQKEEERKQKEEERNQKEEEKRLEDEKKEQEEEAARKKKVKDAQKFKSFFQRKPVKVAKPEAAHEQARFKPFQLKANMTLAPTTRRRIADKKLFDRLVCCEDTVTPCAMASYVRELQELVRKTRMRYSSRRIIRQAHEEAVRKTRLRDNKRVSCTLIGDAMIIEDDSGDCEIEEVDHRNLMPAKFLRFKENTRPPYYGTWRKRSKFISGRKPFAMDQDVFNYDIDSDEEWEEEEEPGENLSDVNDDVDKDEDKDEDEDEEDEDGFFVPHGYLSDDEGVKDSGDEEGAEEGEKQGVDGAVNKLKASVVSIDVEVKKKMKPRKPICIGPLFTNYIDDVNVLLRKFGKVELFASEGADAIADEDDVTEENGDPKTPKTPKTPSASTSSTSGVHEALAVPEEAMPMLITFLHGNTAGMVKLIKGFKEFWQNYSTKNYPTSRSLISKRQLEKKILSISSRTSLPPEHGNKTGYVVNTEHLEKYKLADIPLGRGLPPLDNDEGCGTTTATTTATADREMTCENSNHCIVEADSASAPQEMEVDSSVP